MELRNAPFLEASRRSSKEGGAKSQEEYKGAQDAKVFVVVFFLVIVLVVSSGGLLGRDLRLVVACLWRSGPWNDPFVGARSRWGVRAWHEGRGREVPLCQLCRASLRIRVESAGESSPAPWKAELSRGCPSCRGDRRRDSPTITP